MVTATPIGNSLDVTVLRDGKRENFKVVVGDLAQFFPDRFGNGNDSGQAQPGATTVSFGMSIQTLTDRQRETFGIQEKGGVQVVDVDPNSFAEDCGLIRNDVVLSINNKPVTSTEDVKKIAIDPEARRCGSLPCAAPLRQRKQRSLGVALPGRHAAREVRGREDHSLRSWL